MGAGAIHSLVIALARLEGRSEAALELAAALGCDSMALLVRDAALGGVLLPAAGMPKTLAGGAGWRALLATCASTGRHRATIDLPAGTLHAATALSHAGLVAVLVGGEPDASGLEVLDAELPLLDALMRTEHALTIGAADAALARDGANRAHALARALDASRAASTKLNQELRREHERKDEFLAMLAHELRNPLAPLVNSIEILRRTGLYAPLVERQVDVMARQLGQLTHLVNDLLDVSRVSRGLIELRREALPLAQVLDAAVEAVRPTLDARGHQLQLLGADMPLHVNGDRVRLTQVFANLLQNAVKYTDPGGKLTVSVTADGPRVSVMVRDTGVGIPPDMLTQIFKLFMQVPGGLDRAQGGLGIGLTLVRTLVELHGGHVSAHSVGLGRGSTFTVSLPLVSAAISPVPETGPRAVLASRPVVLVVDDNLDSAESLAEVLRMMGAHATVAADGTAAIESAARHPPALVLLDIGLPGMDGYETARRLRSASTAPMRLVALTGYGGDRDRDRSRAAGFDDHVVKPIAPEALETLLASVAAVSA